jgi:hypothetical protein
MSNIKFYSPVDVDDTSSGLTVAGDLTVDTNVLYVDTTNDRVGIGTTSPSNEILHVAGNIMMDGSILRMASSTTKLVLQNVGGSWNSLSAKGINIGDWSTDPSYGDIRVGDYDFDVIKTDGTHIIKAKNNGNVLIGTTTDSGYKLDVNGTAQIKDYLRITNTGGTQRLLLGNQDSSGANNPSIISAANGNTYIGGGNSWTGYGGTIDYTATFTDGGNVGIGTTSPSYKLQVKGASAAVGDGDQIFSVGNTTGGTQLAIGSSEDSYTWIRSYESGVGGRDLVFASNGENMRITSGGNVLIGTTTDSGYKLDVTGELRVTSVLRANSNAIVGGYLDAQGDFLHRGDIKVLNKASSNWLIWAQRDTAASQVVVDLNYIGTITPGSDSAYDIGSSSVRFANGYFDTLYGDGSNLTGITATETDTLDSVTSRGSTTSNAIGVGGLNVDSGTLYVDSTNNRVGIGTTAPASTLMVHSTGSTAVSKQWQTIISDNNTLAADRGGGIIFRGRYSGTTPANFCGIRAGKLK